MQLLVFRQLVTQCVALLALFALPTFIFAAVPSPSSWQPIISTTNATPAGFVAVDKKRQQLFFLQKNTPLKVKNTFICSTGQIAGDKFIEGDLRTPEGIYFVVQHLTSGLNFSLYGKEAYTLNYPNPVDKLHKKTGYGIWIHGRGRDIVPLQTQGCIALNNGDLAILGNMLRPGTPVLLSSTFLQTSSLPMLNSKVVQLESLVKAWAKSWEDRSAKMFDFYNKEAYTISTESFVSFKSNKERVFKNIPWIKTTIQNIQILQGPDYWVTWFYQDYNAPNMQSKGVRRLYWQENSNNDFKIIGMEWLPGENSEILLASKDSSTSTEKSTPKTEPQTTEVSLFGLNKTQPSSQKSIDKKTSVDQKLTKADPVVVPPKNENNTKPVKVTPSPIDKVQLAEKKKGTEEVKHTSSPSAGAEQLIAKGNRLKSLTNSWAKSWNDRSLQMFDFYNQKQYSATTEAFSKFKRTKKQLFTSLPWIKIRIHNIRVSKGKDYWVTTFYQEYDAPNLHSRGVRRLYWKENGQNDFKITRMEWSPRKTTVTLPRREKEIFTSQATLAPVPIVANESRVDKDTSKSNDKNNKNDKSSTKKASFVPVKDKKDSTTEPKKLRTRENQEASPDQKVIQEKNNKLKSLVVAWAKAWANRSVTMFDFYDSNAYSLNTESFSTFIGTKKRLFKNLSWIKTRVHQITVKPFQKDWITEFYMEYSAQNLTANGIRRLYWREIGKNNFKIIRMEFNPNSPLPAPSLSNQEMKRNVDREKNQLVEKSNTKEIAKPNELRKPIKNQLKPYLKEISIFVEKWRRSWERSNLNEYIRFYADNAIQGNKIGKNAINSQKKRLWSYSRPTSVVLRNFVYSTVDQNSIRIEMSQEYTDSSSNKEKGIKILIIKRINDKLLITDEQWRPSPNENKSP